jgi:YfiH family protein
MIYFNKFKTFKNLKYGFSTKAAGNMSFNWGENEEVIKNRRSFLKSMSILPNDCVVMSPLHGTEIRHIDSAVKGIGILKPGGIEADCLITKEKGLFLFLLTGDCLPILLYDPQQKTIALAHISRKNTSQLFAQKIIKKLAQEFNCQSADLEIGIGPGIHKESYKKPIDMSEKQMPRWRNYITDEPDGQISIDLISYNKKQIVEAGVRLEKIEVCNIDTAQSKKIFSHHRSEKTKEPEGRFATIIGMV